MTRKKTKVVQQVIHGHSRERFHAELNELLLDGWRVVVGSYNFTRVPGVPSANTPARYINEHGVTYEPHYFIAIEREELIDTAALKRLRESAEVTG
jgi:hypothetical protein